MQNKFKPIALISQKKNFLEKLGDMALKFGHTIELLVIIVIWAFIFSGHADFGGFSRSEMFTYIIAGGFISLLTGTLMYKLISHDLYQDKSKLIVYRPFRYLRHILSESFTIYLVPFLLSLVGQALILYFLLDFFIVNLDPAYLSVIFLMGVLAYLIEFLIAYILHLYFITYFDKEGFMPVLIRLKKILAGNYFPLSFLPLVFVKISLFFPFAYSFFIPAQLYLKNIDVMVGVRGLLVQSVWIVLIYLLIKRLWSIRIRRMSG